MTKESLKKILEYYIAEEQLYLYYENGMYPSWVSKQELINLITNKVLKDISPNREELLEFFQDFFTFHNEANKGFSGIDDLFNKWYDARFPSKSDEPHCKIQPKNE